MISYTPPEGHIGSLVQALHETEALLQVLRSEQFTSRAFVEEPAAVRGILEWSCSPVSRVSIFWEGGRLCITAAEDSLPMSQRPQAGAEG